jgi:hypothetical protein
MQDVTTEVPRTTSSLTESPICDRHKARPSRFSVRNLLSRFRTRLICSLCIWISGFYSWRGHIRIQSPTELPSVDFGPCLDSDCNGRLSLNTRTLARKLYTKKIAAIYPWMDMVDRQMFLNGFDAGELLSLDTGNSALNIGHPATENNSWLTPEIAREIHLNIDMLKRQWYKSQYESAGHSDPSPSD